MNILSRLRHFARKELGYHYQRIRRMPFTWRNWSQFWKDYDEYRAIAAEEVIDLQPNIDDKTSQTPIDPIYYYQDAWAFERILKHSPAAHIDVGSHNKFVALLSKVIPTTMVDIRPLSLSLASVKFIEGSILDMPFDDGSCDSISSICVVEHIGLGRYGDPLDPEGTQKAIRELIRILAPGGHLFLSVPIDDTNHTCFNGQRVFTEEAFLELCRPLSLADKAYIFGREFVSTRESGLGTGCYELVKSN